MYVIVGLSDHLLSMLIPCYIYLNVYGDPLIPNNHHAPCNWCRFGGWSTVFFELKGAYGPWCIDYKTIHANLFWDKKCDDGPHSYMPPILHVFPKTSHRCRHGGGVRIQWREVIYPLAIFFLDYDAGGEGR